MYYLLSYSEKKSSLGSNATFHLACYGPEDAYGTDIFSKETLNETFIH